MLDFRCSDFEKYSLQIPNIKYENVRHREPNIESQTSSIETK